MSPALPALTARQVLRALGSAGFVHVSTKGSHAKLVDDTGRIVVVPLHGGRDIPRGTLGSIPAPGRDDGRRVPTAAVIVEAVR